MIVRDPASKRGHDGVWPSRAGGTCSAVAALAALLGLAALAGCGSSDDQDSAPAATPRALAAQSAARSAGRALAFWARYDCAALTDFQEKGRRPERLWPADWGPGPDGDEARRAWRETLEETLPEALARAERDSVPPEPSEPSRPGPPAATIEQVNRAPQAWYGVEVRFENVRLRGPIRSDADYGPLLAVTSPAGEFYPASASGERLVFSTYRDAAHDLKDALAGGRDARATIDCKITKARRMGLTGMKTFPKAVIHRVELYPE